MIKEESFWFFFVLENLYESWSNLFWKSEKKLGYKRLQLCSWKKYFSKIWKGAQQGYFCRNFKLAYRGKFLIFFNAWKCARKLKCFILIMSKKIGIQALTNVFLKKKQFAKKNFFKIFFQNIFFQEHICKRLCPIFLWHYQNIILQLSCALSSIKKY